MNPYAIIGAIGIAFLAALAGGRIGYNMADGKWEKIEAQRNAEYGAALKAAEDKARAAEQAGNLRVASISEQYESRLKEAQDAKDAALRSARSGARRLSIGAKCPAASTSAAPATPAPATERDGEARAELSGSSVDFLVGLATEADIVAKQLAACQALVLSDRMVK